MQIQVGGAQRLRTREQLDDRKPRLARTLISLCFLCTALVISTQPTFYFGQLVAEVEQQH